MNKKVFLPVFLILLALPFLLQAQPITSRKAVKIASKYINQVAGKPQTRGGEADKQSYYIFNDGDGDGFVIVAGDSRMNEVVGYSKTGRVNTAAMPPALQVYLADYEQYVKALGTTKVHYKATATQKAVGPLLKTKWNQRSPFNDKAPELWGKKPPIGCVATAMSQVMNFHKWPVKGKGKCSYTPSYTDAGQSYGLQDVNFEESNYQWDKMTWDCKDPEAAAAVAKLMYDVSVSVRMDFKPGVSGAQMSNAVDAFKEYFNYEADLIQRDYMSSTAFMEILRNELRQGFPVVFSGNPERSGMGHAWVCDGFNELGLFSMNWGWGGASDGYFDLSYLNPFDRGDGGSGVGGYIRSQDFIRIHPNKSGSARLEPIRKAFDFKEDGFIIPNKEETTRKDGLELRFENLGNFSSYQDFKSRVGVGIFKQLDENPSEIIDFGENYTNIALPFGACFAEVKKNITFDKLLDGTYYLHPMTKTVDQDKDWYKTGRPCYLKIEISGDKVKVIERTDKPALQIVSTPTGATEVPSGTSAEYKVRIVNTSTRSFIGTLKVLIKGKDKQYTYQPVNSTFRFMDNTEAIRKINVSFLDDMETGEYELGFLFEYYNVSSNNGGHELVQLEQPLKVKVVNTLKSAYLSYMNTYVISGNVSIDEEKINVDKYPEMQVFAKSINIGKERFNGNLRYFLEDVETKERIQLETKDYVLAQGASDPVSLPIISMKQYFAKMVAGHSYHIVTEVYNGAKREYEWVYNQQVLTRGVSTGIDRNNDVDGYMATYQRNNNMLNIDTNKPLTSLDVYTSDGSLVFTRHHLSAGHHEVSLSRLGSGVYIIVSRYAGGRKVMRIAK